MQQKLILHQQINDNDEEPVTGNSIELQPKERPESKYNDNENNMGKSSYSKLTAGEVNTDNNIYGDDGEVDTNNNNEPLELDYNDNVKIKKNKKCSNVQFFVFLFDIIKRGSSILDAVTDILLLYAASSSASSQDTKLLMIVLCISLLAPYILSYSNGIALFLYRKTFDNVKGFSFQSCLLMLYILPTGICYFIIIDIVDALLSVYKLFGNIRCKSREDIIKMESNFIEVFGMSRMDWISFRKQKKIAQFWFETTPQVILQSLLYFEKIPGKELSGITDRALLLSVSFALLNSIFSIFELFAESRGVHETFVEYSLHCITARFGWVPLSFIISDYFHGRLPKSHSIYNNNGYNSCCKKLCGFKVDKSDKYNNSKNTLIIDYDMKYRIPLFSYLTHDAITVKISYLFNSNTIKSLMAMIKSHKSNSDNGKSRSYSYSTILLSTSKLQIYFGKSLNLLTVREIISLMQCCHSMNIELPDIHLIDWFEIFKNQSIRNDPRLYSNTFDEIKRPLLISLYLTGYSNNNWQILKQFIFDFDVPINITDNEGNTILHHMLQKNDNKASKVLFNSLKPNQRINFNLENDEGEVIMHEIIKKYGINGLNNVLNALKPRQKINFNYQDINGDTIFHHLVNTVIKNNKIKLLKDSLYIISSININNMYLSVSNNSNQSIISFALKNDKKYLTKIKHVKIDIEKKVEHEQSIIIEELEQEYENEYQQEIEEEYIYEQDEKKDDSENEINELSNQQDVEEVHNQPELEQEYEEDEEVTENENENILDNQQDTDKLQLKNKWEQFKESWSAAGEKSYISNAVMINILYLFVNRVLFKEIHSDTDYIEKEKKIKWIDIEIKKLYKLSVDNYGLKRLLKLEILKRSNTNNDYDNVNKMLSSLRLLSENNNKNYSDQMVHRILLQYDENINLNAHNYPQQSILGYILTNYIEYIEYFDIINYLLETYKNIKLLVHEISIFVKLFEAIVGNDYNILYFNIFEKVLKHSNINIESVIDEGGNTPIHRLVKRHEKKNSILKYVSKLNTLCLRYPQWLFIKNRLSETPLFIAVNRVDVDGFFTLSRYMCEYNKNAFDRIITDRTFINKMIYVGSELLKKNKEKTHRMNLLLKCFDYFEIFYYPSYKTHIDNIRNDYNLHKSNHISLIGKVSTDRIKKYKWESVIHILFTVCGLNRLNHEKEFKKSNTVVQYGKPNNEIIIDWQDYFTEITKENENKRIFMNLINQDEKEKLKDNIELEKDELFITELKHVNWVEIIYSTVVESFSVMDLYTDVLIFIELYRTDNPWWATTMALLVLSPYLVSYCSLSSLLLQKLVHFRNKSLLSFFVLLLMTPLSVLYLVSIDIIFMIYSLSSTFIFMICGCRTKYDIKDWLDEYVFNKLLKMNRTEIIGYRRLRTLSQLFFETMPQILLQGRILYVVELKKDNNQFQINVTTLVWSLALAVAHLILEGGVVYFDAKTLKMRFSQYCMICLGGRVGWIPYQHFLEYIIRNQLFINSVFDINYSDKQLLNKQSIFKPLRYLINCMSEDDVEINNNDNKQLEEAKNQMALSYENIENKILFFRYEIIYQFSNALIQHLTQELLNAPSMIIPKAFKLSTTNINLQNFFQCILSQAELHLGYESCGNINMTSLCELYKASLNKLKLNINKLDKKTIKKIKRNSSENSDFKEIITTSLIYAGELHAIEWIYNVYNLSDKDKSNIAINILENILPNDDLDNDKYMQSQLIDLICLRNCFKNGYIITNGISNCLLMKDIKRVIDGYSTKCNYDGSWCYVLMMVLFYSQGTVFCSDCINGCCENIIKNNKKLKELFEQYLPISIEFKEMLIPYQLFECSKLFKYYQTEHILINQCKNWIIINDDKNNNKLQDDINNININKVEINQDIKLNYIGKEENNKIIKKLLAPEIEPQDVALLDEIVYEFRLYQNYNTYLNKTLKYRELINCEAKFNTKLNEEYIEIPLYDIIPEWNTDNHKRHQIYEIIISDSTDENIIKQIYFENLNEKTSVLNKDTYLWINNNDDNQMDEEIIIDENNIGLSYYNYNLLHHTDNIPKITIQTSKPIECEIFIYVKYAYLYRETDQVTQRKHSEMSLFAYSKLLYDHIDKNIKQFNDQFTESELMTFCFELSLWVTLPNKAIFERDIKQFIELLERCELITNINIAQTIATFIIHPRNYLHWQQFATFEHFSLPNIEDLEYLQDQLVYQCGDNMVDYRRAQRDYINVPTPIFDRKNKKKYLVNIYILGKGDESIFALVPVKDYKDDTGIRYFNTALGATGGRMWNIRSAGRFASSPCTGNQRDCNHGVIKKGREILIHPIDAHIPGDWLNFVIDFDKNIFTLYRNGVFQATVSNQIPDGDLFMVCHPDTKVDKFFIEEEIDQGIFQKLVGDKSLPNNNNDNDI